MPTKGEINRWRPSVSRNADGLESARQPLDRLSGTDSPLHLNMSR